MTPSTDSEHPLSSIADDFYPDLATALESAVNLAKVDGLKLVMVDASAEPIGERTAEVTLTLKVKQRITHGERWRLTEIEAAQKVVSNVGLLMAHAGGVLMDREVSASEGAK